MVINAVVSTMRTRTVLLDLGISSVDAMLYQRYRKVQNESGSVIYSEEAVTTLESSAIAVTHLGLLVALVSTLMQEQARAGPANASFGGV